MLALLVSQTEPIDAGGMAMDGLEHSGRVFDALLYFAIAVLVCGIGAWALMRVGRRHLKRLQDKPATPTTVVDVWSMHRAPSEDAATENPEDEEPADEP